MAATNKRTISLPEEQAQFIDAKVASGDYASASEVVRAGLRALKERDDVIERWLIEEVVPTYDALAANPDDVVSLEDAFAQVRARHAERVKAGK